MDHNESLRKFERLIEKEAAHAHELATELEALGQDVLVSILVQSSMTG